MKRMIAAAMLALFGSAQAQEAAMAPASLGTITEDEWQAYRGAFVTGEGRVVDTANSGISHSEGQGYGLLLAYLAEDRASFERIWSFTSTELMIRNDGLAAWRWEPDADPHVNDANNATDGDILIAYALALAGTAWNDGVKLQRAAELARTLGETMLVEANGYSAILPGEYGFSARERGDGPVVNLSYWVFEAFPVLAELSPESGWLDVGQDGIALLDAATREGRLPPDWIALGNGSPVPAADFPPEFGYNNIRIPLYLMRADADPELLARFVPAFDGGFAPARIDVTTGERLETMAEPGYRLIGAALACILEGAPVPAELQAFEPASYYGSTLHLLALAHLRNSHAACLDTGHPATNGTGQE